MYQPLRHSRSEFVDVRSLRYHLRIWEATDPSPTSTTWFVLHGWMDVSASFQFLVDQLPAHWRIIAPDWRGYGLTQRPQADCYWFADYLGDLEAIVDHCSPSLPVNLIGHSMGGNIAALYAGIRPARVARLVNLEGLGLRRSQPDEAPGRYGQWLDELRSMRRLRSYASRSAVIDRLMSNHPRLVRPMAEFLAEHWAEQGANGQFEVRGDPAHKIVNPYLYQVDEVTACWSRIQAPTLWVISEFLDHWRQFVDSPEYQRRLAVIAKLERARIDGAGHMMHLDKPAALASCIAGFAERHGGFQ